MDFEELQKANKDLFKQIIENYVLYGDYFEELKKRYNARKNKENYIEQIYAFYKIYDEYNIEIVLNNLEEFLKEHKNYNGKLVDIIDRQDFEFCDLD